MQNSPLADTRTFSSALACKSYRLALCFPSAGRKREGPRCFCELTFSFRFFLSLCSNHVFNLTVLSPRFRAQRVAESSAQLQPVQQRHGLSHVELPPSRRQPGASASQLGDGLHRNWHGLLHRVSREAETVHIFDSVKPKFDVRIV